MFILRNTIIVIDYIHTEFLYLFMYIFAK
jgi:hypothetical protein